MQHDWFRGAAVTIRYDDDTGLVLIVANNGRVPTLELPAAGFVSATVDGGKLSLLGAFTDGNSLALKLPPADSAGIAAALASHLGLPRAPHEVTLADLPNLPHDTYIQISGRCSDRGLLEHTVALVGMSTRLDDGAPYRITGFYRRGEIRVTLAQHLNPPVELYAGASIRVMYAPEQDRIAIFPAEGARFVEPAGTLTMWLSPAMVAWAVADGDGIVFVGDLAGYSGQSPRLAPVAAEDAHAVVGVLERFGIPRAPSPMTPAELWRLERPTYVWLDGTHRAADVDRSNFEGGFVVRPADGLVVGARYRITGYAYPPPRAPIPGHNGPTISAISIQPLG